MFRKLNPLVLFALLVVLLLAVVVIMRMDARRQQGSFLRELANADPAKTTDIKIIPRGMVEDAIHLERSNGEWMAGMHGNYFMADPELIERIFMIVSPMVPEQLVSKSTDVWVEYEVDDISGTRVSLYEGKRLRSEFIVGGFQFQEQMIQGQQSPRINTYVRPASQDDVYTVPGFLSAAFPPDVNNYRYQVVTEISKGDIEKIEFSSGGPEDFSLHMEGITWLINNSTADSLAANRYIDKIANSTSNAFVEDKAEGWLSIPSHQIKVYRKTDVPVEILAYPADTTHRFFITSSQNPGSVFSGSKNDLFDNLFKPAAYFYGTGD